MNSLSVKRFSILGIVLVAASAVTAAVVPSKAKSTRPMFAMNGKLHPTLTPRVANQQTCKPTILGEGEQYTCHDTATGVTGGSLTTVSGLTSATLTNGVNVLNTTVGDSN